MKITSRKQNKLNLIFILLLLILSLYFYRDSIDGILAGVGQVGIGQLLICSCLSLLSYFCESLVIHGMAGLLLPEYSFGSAVALAFQCEFYRLITLGSGAGIAEIHSLHKKGLEPAKGTVMTLLQYVIKKTGIMLLGILGFLFLSWREGTRRLCQEYIFFLFTGSALTILMVLFLLFITLSSAFTFRVLKLLQWAGGKFPSFAGKLASLEDQLSGLNETGKILFRQKSRLLRIIFRSLLKLSFFYAVPAWLLYGKSPLSAAECFFLMAVVYMLAGIIPSPSGIGSLEFVFLLFFGAFMDSGTAVPAVLVFRFVTWILPFAVGGILTFFQKIRTAAEE